MKLGTVLVRAGVISPAQLDEALRMQKGTGERLGTILVEMKAVSVETLGMWLGRISGFPCATAELLQAAPRELVELLPGELAQRLECIPFRRDGGVLHVATVNPYNPAVTEALATRIRLPILLYVVPETLFHRFLKLHYGLVPLPARPPVSTPPASTRSRPPVRSVAPNRTSPRTLPPAIVLPDATAPAPTDLPPVRAAVPAVTIPPAVPPERTPDVSLPSAPVVHQAEDTSARVQTAPREERVPAPVRPRPRIEGRPSRFTVAEATAALMTAPARNGIVETLLRYAASVLDSAILLVVRDGFAIGWAGHGERVLQSEVGLLAIPLNAPSPFREAYEGRRPAGGVIADDAAHSAMLKVLRSPPASAVVVPIILRDRVVNLLYADRAVGPDALDAADALLEVAFQAGEAYARILRERRPVERAPRELRPPS